MKQPYPCGQERNPYDTKSASGKPLFLLPSQTLLSSLPRRFAPASLRSCVAPACLLPSYLLTFLPPASCLLPPAYCLLSSLPRRFAPASLRPAFCLLTFLPSYLLPPASCLLPTASCPHFLVASLLRRSGLPHLVFKWGI